MQLLLFLTTAGVRLLDPVAAAGCIAPGLAARNWRQAIVAAAAWAVFLDAVIALALLQGQVFAVQLRYLMAAIVGYVALAAVVFALKRVVGRLLSGSKRSRAS